MMAVLAGTVVLLALSLPLLLTYRKRRYFYCSCSTLVALFC